jgi:hypothetical protein
VHWWGCGDIGSHENILRGGTVPGSSESFAHGNLGF